MQKEFVQYSVPVTHLGEKNNNYLIIKSYFIIITLINNY